MSTGRGWLTKSAFTLTIRLLTKDSEQEGHKICRNFPGKTFPHNQALDRIFSYVRCFYLGEQVQPNRIKRGSIPALTRVGLALI